MSRLNYRQISLDNFRKFRLYTRDLFSAGIPLLITGSGPSEQRATDKNDFNSERGVAADGRCR